MRMRFEMEKMNGTSLPSGVCKVRYTYSENIHAHKLSLNWTCVVLGVWQKKKIYIFCHYLLFYDKYMLVIDLLLEFYIQIHLILWRYDNPYYRIFLSTISERYFLSKLPLMDGYMFHLRLHLPDINAKI